MANASKKRGILLLQKENEETNKKPHKFNLLQGTTLLGYPIHMKKSSEYDTV